MAQIVTSSFYSRLPSTFERVSIARWAPKGCWALPTLRALAPGKWFRDVTIDQYADLYFTQLAALDPREILLKIEDFGAGRPVALLCWERPHDSQFCHRGFVSWWLKQEAGLDICEFGRESDGVGECHPKLPDGYRLTPQLPLL